MDAKIKEEGPMKGTVNYLGLMVDLRATMRHEGTKDWRYSGLEDVVSQEGVAFLDVEHRKGVAKQCFANAFHLVCQEPDRYVYVEGVASNVIPTHHAWVWDRKTQKAVDVTWDSGEGYVGIPFNTEVVMLSFLSTGSVLDDYKRGFPVYSMNPEEFVEPCLGFEKTSK